MSTALRRDKARLRAAKWYRENRERALRSQAAWRAANPDAWSRWYGKAKADEQWVAAKRQAQREAAAANRDAARARGRAAYRRHAPKRIASVREYQRRNPEKARLWALQKNAARRSLKLTADSRAWIAVILRDPCSYCGARGRVGVEHVLPVTRGGDNRPENLAAACQRCNCSRGNKSIAAWMLARRDNGNRAIAG